MAKPENKRPVERRKDGTIAPGASGNPGGRPKGYADFREACRDRTPQALAALEAALSDDKLCVQAASVLLMHGWGKPQSAPEDLEALTQATRPLRDVATDALARLARLESVGESE
jgi:hypothetical protein